MSQDYLILLVEDDENDQVFLQRAFTQAGARVKAVDNGEVAVEYLCGRNSFADRKAHPLPHLLVTDLKMPRIGGIDLLRWLRQNAELAWLPAIVLTSSSNQSEIALAYQLGARGYMIKPVQFADLEKLTSIVIEYWKLSCMSLSSNAGSPE